MKSLTIRQPFAVLVLLAVATTLVTCGRSDGSVTQERTSPTGDAVSLSGTEWVLKSLNGHGLAHGTNITLEFGRHAFSGFTGCNSYGGKYEASEGGELKVPGMDVTLMDCPGDKGRQEKSYLDALVSAAGYQVRDSRLEIQSAAGEATLLFEQKAQWNSDPDDLVGTRWKLRSLNGKPPLESVTPMLAFDSRTEYSSYDGCQHLSGTYDANADDLWFTSGGVKEPDCMKPEAWSERGGGLPEASAGGKGDYRLSEEQLEIRTEAGDTYIFVPLQEGEKVERPGASWVLESFVEAGTATPVMAGTEITLSFDRGTLRESGVVSGSAGCNAYTADYTYRGDSLTLETRAVTEQACESPAGVMRQEERYLSILEDVNGYHHKIDGRLHLTATDERELVFAGPQIASWSQKGAASEGS